MKLLKQGIAAIIITMMAFSFAAAQDVGVPDTLRVVCDSTWTIMSAADSISPPISIYGWIDDSNVGGASLPFIVRWDTTGYDWQTDRWGFATFERERLGGGGVVAGVDTLYVSSIDSMFIPIELTSGDLNPATQFIPSISYLDSASYWTSGVRNWGYNGVSVGLVTIGIPDPVPFFPVLETTTKIAEFRLKLADLSPEMLPDSFHIIIDTLNVPTTQVVKYSPSGGTGYLPHLVTPGVLKVLVPTLDADDDNPSEELLPQQFQLAQNYPNPFNPTTTIKYYVASKGIVNLSVYNILGQRVKTLVNGQMDIGWQEAQWNGRDESGNSVASGIYFYKMSAGDYVDTKKMLLMK